MAKRKTRRKSTKSAPVHKLPAGFWSQVGALILIAIAILYVVAWFKSGGPVVEWIEGVTLNLIGYAVYVLPFVFIYVAVEILRAENNKIPVVAKFAAGLLLVWLAGLFGLLKDQKGHGTGGWLGDQLNNYVFLQMVSPGVAIFIYILLIFVTILFLTRTSLTTIIDAVKSWVQNNLTEEEAKANSKIIKAANNDEKVENTEKRPSKIKLAFGGGHKNIEEETQKPEPKAKQALKINTALEDVAEPEPTQPEAKKPKLNSSFQGSVERDTAEEQKQAFLSAEDPNWVAPPLDLLDNSKTKVDSGDVESNAETIQTTLKEFGIDVQMEGVNIGPRVSQYTLRPPTGVKLEKISNLETNIAYNLAASNIRIEAPIPGKKAVGIEVPNIKPAAVKLRSLLSSKDWKKSKEPLTFTIGQDIGGENVYGELNKMPHLLIAGQTGAGKSVMMNSLITSLLFRNSPSEMKLILVDPKQVEMAPYADIPHLLTPVITDPDKTISALKWAVNEMERRYRLLAEEKIREIKTYNERLRSRGRKVAIEDEDGNMQEHDQGGMPYIVIVIDEMADLMMRSGKEVEALIVMLAQKARAVGIHLVLATQRPSVNVITGLIKANVPSRIAFSVASQVDSRTIIDVAGAEKLLGNGDMLMKTAQMRKPKRVQGVFLTDKEVNDVTDYLRMQSAPQYNDDIISQNTSAHGAGFGLNMGGDAMYQQAVELVIDKQKASTTMLQNYLKIGYARAARIIGEMEENGVIGPQNGSKPRQVLVSSLEPDDDQAE